MKWSSFTPIQDMAIPVIINTKKDVILSSGTASGKTEAAFMPILSLIEKEAEDKLKVIYISPLKALINNQFDRIEKLCEYTNISIHKWHGDISQSKKKKFVENPSGILQITPESIESFFVNRTEQLSSIFIDVDFIIIDEIHSFLDSNRGIHLRSLISRLERYSRNKPRIIGLSATISNYSMIKKWVNHKNTHDVEIIESPGSDKNLMYSLMYFESSESHKTPLRLYEDIRELTREQKSLIFCNRRGQVEETTVILNRLAKRDNIGETYYAHHSSIDKKEREYVENTMSESTLPKSIIATSSLELGIDIGSIDIVIQIDSTFTVSSLKQRLGRSGRKTESSQILQLYSTTEDSLIQSLAVMELVKEKWVEPAHGYKAPYDILFHQIISICKESNGIQLNKLLNQIITNDIFSTLDVNRVGKLIEYMLENEYLEMIKGLNELIVGLESERLLRGKEYYSVFMTTEQYDVLFGTKKIGTLDRLVPININDNIILSGKLWKITDIDTYKNKVYVKPASDGNAPKYLGGGAKIHKVIGEKIMAILCSNENYSYINEEAISALQDQRNPYHIYNISNNQRVIWLENDKAMFETFTGTTIANTIVWMLRHFGLTVKISDGLSRIELSNDQDIIGILSLLKSKKWSNDELLSETSENEFFESKFFDYLPGELQREMHIAHEVDINGALEFLNSFEFRLIDLRY